MKLVVPYRMTNEVVEFVENETIAWRHLGGHIWRYRLDEVDGGTKITEEFDWRTVQGAAVPQADGLPGEERGSRSKRRSNDSSSLVDDTATLTSPERWSGYP